MTSYVSDVQRIRSGDKHFTSLQLEVKPDANETELKKAYRRAAIKVTTAFKVILRNWANDRPLYSIIRTRTLHLTPKKSSRTLGMTTCYICHFLFGISHLVSLSCSKAYQTLQDPVGVLRADLTALLTCE